MIPEVGRFRRIRMPRVEDHTLGNGLRVVAVHRGGAPLVELRLRVPYPASTAPAEARRDLLSRTMMSGTGSRSETEIAIALQSIGGALQVSTDSDGFRIAGAALAEHLDGLLRLLIDVLVGATYPDPSVWVERERFAEEITLARSQPEVLAADAIRRRLYGRHPYGLGLPAPSTVRRVTPSALRSLHDEALRPSGATLVIAGDVRAPAAVETVEGIVRAWKRRRRPSPPPPPVPPRPGPVRVIDRPGSRQAAIRLAGLALPTSDPAYPAVELASLIFGGYFSSRLVRNIREDKGYTYSASSRISHGRVASSLNVAADVRSEVAGAALVEILYELGRMVSSSPSQDELDEARRYRIGTLSIGIHTQAGFADALSTILARGHDVGYLRDHPVMLEQVDRNDVLAAARRYLAPARLVGVIVGDADVIVPQIEPIAPVFSGSL